MTDDDRKGAEAFLASRGWKKLPTEGMYAVKKDEPDKAWVLPSAIDPDLPRMLWHTKALTLENATSRQLKQEVTAFIFMLETIDEKKPGTRQILGALLLSLVTDALAKIWADQRAMVELGSEISQRIKESLPKLFENTSFRQAIEAVRMLWHVHGKAAEKKQKGEDEKPN